MTSAIGSPQAPAELFEPSIYLALTGVAVVTGFIDAIAGGGGLIMMPALLFAGVPPIQALGTNKLQSMFGTATALRNYWRSGLVTLSGNRLTAAVVFIGAAAGCLIVQSIKVKALNLIIPSLLVASALYVLLSPRMSDDDAHHRVSAKGYAPIGGAIGFYDGFFGPGTGSFLMFIFIGLFGFDFLTASASSKVINLATNVAAVIVFAAFGLIYYEYALPMGVCNVAGAIVGTRLAMLKGNRFVRHLFLDVVTVMIARFAWEQFGK